MMFFTLLLSSFLTFVELNCENLFDTRHDSLKNDLQFTPEGEYQWTTTRYWDKLNKISQELIALGEDSVNGSKIPDLIALCEVENDSVLTDLTKRSLLRQAGYEYLMTNSPDERGIDVALVYNPASFAPITQRSIRIVQLPDTHPTRDILYVSGLISNGDTLHVFTVHAPSRRGGEIPSMPYRLQVARQLGEAVDSIYALHPHANIIISGDFNDYHDSPALDSLYQHQLTNVSAGVKGTHGALGTYRYRGEWNSLDQIICSPKLTGKLMDCKVGDLPFLLEEDKRNGGVKPFRTFLGPAYHHGYSDHLPLVARFRLE